MSILCHPTTRLSALASPAPSRSASPAGSRRGAQPLSGPQKRQSGSCAVARPSPVERSFVAGAGGKRADVNKAGIIAGRVIGARVSITQNGKRACAARPLMLKTGFRVPVHRVERASSAPMIASTRTDRATGKGRDTAPVLRRCRALAVRAIPAHPPCASSGRRGEPARPGHCAGVLPRRVDRPLPGWDH